MRQLGYTRATTTSEAIRIWRERGEGTRFIAGGTSLHDLMKLDIERPVHLIDVGRLEGLDRIEIDGGGLRIGARALMNDVAADPAVATHYPLLSESLSKAASNALRNMASVGGNLLQRTRCPYFRHGTEGLYPCNKREPGSGCAAIGGFDRAQALFGASPSCTAVSPGDWPVALVALDASVELVGPEGERSLPVAELYRPPGDTPQDEFTLLPGELITAITVPSLDWAVASTYHKLADRESFAFATVSAAVALDLRGDTVREARIALGGVGTVPWRAREAEAALADRALTPEVAREAGRIAFLDAVPGEHNAFKIELGARAVADALQIAARRSRS